MNESTQTAVQPVMQTVLPPDVNPTPLPFDSVGLIPRTELGVAIPPQYSLGAPHPKWPSYFVTGLEGKVVPLSPGTFSLRVRYEYTPPEPVGLQHGRLHTIPAGFEVIDWAKYVAQNRPA